MRAGRRELLSVKSMVVAGERETGIEDRQEAVSQQCLSSSANAVANSVQSPLPPPKGVLCKSPPNVKAWDKGGKGERDRDRNGGNGLLQNR